MVGTSGGGGFAANSVGGSGDGTGNQMGDTGRGVGPSVGSFATGSGATNSSVVSGIVTGNGVAYVSLSIASSIQSAAASNYPPSTEGGVSSPTTISTSSGVTPPLSPSQGEISFEISSTPVLLQHRFHMLKRPRQHQYLLLYQLLEHLLHPKSYLTKCKANILEAFTRTPVITTILPIAGSTFSERQGITASCPGDFPSPRAVPNATKQLATVVVDMAIRNEKKEINCTTGELPKVVVKQSHGDRKYY